MDSRSISETTYPTADRFAENRRLQLALLFAAMFATLAAVFGAMGALSYTAPRLSGLVVLALGIVVFLILALPVLIWNDPRIGLYVIFIGGVLCEAGNRPFLPTTWLPFWWNISSIGQKDGGTTMLDALIFSPAEVIIVITALAWLVRAIAKRELKFERGAFFYAILAYMGMVVFGFFHGLAAHGDLKMALYEVRPQFLFLAVYLLTVNLIHKRTEVRAVIWIIIFCVGIQAVTGVIGYLALQGTLTDQGLFVHDTSLCFNLLFFVAFMTVITRSYRKAAIWSLILVPAAIVADFANQRRAGIAAFAIALVPLIPMLAVLFKERRRQIVVFAIWFFTLGAIYLPIAWNSNGIWALPARAIRSQSEPDSRDASSDAYRYAENQDLKYTRDMQPFFGIGYGKPFSQEIPLVKLTTDFLDYMPHNSVLWVWMRLGHVGFFLFMMMFATILIKGVQILKDVRDSQLKLVGALGVLYVLMIFVYGKYDLQMTNPRQMAVTAVLVGILAKLPRLDRGEESVEPAPRIAVAGA